MANVMNYDTGSTLSGTASEELAAQSLAAEPTGAVPAYLDADGVWQYVAPSQVDFFRRQRGADVITVYVES